MKSAKKKSGGNRKKTLAPRPVRRSSPALEGRAAGRLLAPPPEWIPALAEPYLRGYLPHIECGRHLSGYRFLAPAPPALRPGSRLRAGASRPAAPAAGFFLGFLRDARDFPFLRPEPPECLVFCFVEPVGSPLHSLLVADPGSLLRRTAEYIGWLTHRPPRFKLFADRPAALLRHVPMRRWPPAKYHHLSRNFFIETLAWLVRSALVRHLSAQVVERQLVATPAHPPAAGGARRPRLVRAR